MPTRTPAQPHLRELGGFLRARRGSLKPEDLGIDPVPGRRRVSGLRREEVAALAHVSIDYYTRIEQGRVAPSAGVLAELIGALRLDTDQAEYLTSLMQHAGRAPGRASRPQPASARTAQAQLQRFVDQLPETPALVFGPHTEVLAWNRLAVRLYADFGALPARQRNFTRLLFTDAEFARRFVEWKAVARSCVAILRREAVAKPDDPALSALVGELSIADRRFAQLWSLRDVARQDSGTKTLRHPPGRGDDGRLGGAAPRERPRADDHRELGRGGLALAGSAEDVVWAGSFLG